MGKKQSGKMTCEDIDGKEHVVNASELSFRPTVYGVLVEKDKVLLSKKWDGYDFPGGGMEIEETITEALKREFWEESGLKVEIGDVLLCENSFFKNPFKEEYYNSVLMYFSCKKIGGRITTDNFDEHEKEYADMPEWVDINKVDELKFYDPTDCAKTIRKAHELAKKQ